MDTHCHQKIIKNTANTYILIFINEFLYVGEKKYTKIKTINYIYIIRLLLL